MLCLTLKLSPFVVVLPLQLPPSAVPPSSVVPPSITVASICKSLPPSVSLLLLQLLNCYRPQKFEKETMGGTLEYFSGLLRCGHKKKRRKQLQTVELKVRMDCEGCELKVKKALSSMKGVKSVDINRKQQKVSVTGYVESKKVLKKAQSTGKKAEIWPYVPYNLVAYPYAAQAYDKKAPAGYVRNVDAIAISNPGSKQDEQFMNIFSDENPNACSIM